MALEKVVHGETRLIGMPVEWFPGVQDKAESGGVGAACQAVVVKSWRSEWWHEKGISRRGFGGLQNCGFFC